MVADPVNGEARAIHPLHAVLLAFPLPLFLGALLSDVAYWRTFHVQWSNFASWLIAGGLLVGAFAVLWSFINLFRGGRRHRGRRLAYFAALLAAWGLGFVNALVHGKDAWAVMPEGLLLSAAVSVLALVATWIGYSGFRTGQTS